MNERTTDNRNMNEIEAYHLARIEALQASLDAANRTINALREDVAYADRTLQQAVAAGVWNSRHE